MRVGFVVDGRSEFDSLPKLYAAIEAVTGNQFLQPVLAEISPTAPMGILGRVILEKGTGLEARGVDLIIVLVDREQQDECPGSLASRIRDHLRDQRPWRCRMEVVIKDRTYENWLVADPDALMAQPARFRISETVRRSIVPDKADNVDALAILRACAVGTGYNKRRDSSRIMERSDLNTMAGNSRSFRRFLRCVGHPNFRNQSRTPHRG